MKLDYIEWEDSQSPATPSWLMLDEINTKPVIVRSVGKIINERKRSITLASHFTPECVMGVVTIPKSAIRKRKTIKP